MSIVLTRFNGSPADDDIIVITPTSTDFKIQYNSKAAGFHHLFYADETKTVQYIYDLILAVNRDVDPFQYIQFNIPCFPSVIYAITDLYSGLSTTMLNRISEVLKNWPDRVRYGSLSLFSS